MATTFGERLGVLAERHWDKAVALAVGAIEDTDKNRYYWDISDIVENDPDIEEEVFENRASVMFKKMEPSLHEYVLPALCLNRDDYSFADQRFTTDVVVYRLPAPGSRPVLVGGELGYTEYEIRYQDYPYDFNYTLEVWARTRNLAQAMLLRLRARFPKHGKITVVDSLGVEREYYCTRTGVSDLTEVASLVDRVVGFAVSLTIHGEFTDDRIPIVVPGYTGPTTQDPTTLPITDPNNPNNPNYPSGSGPPIGADGLYATGCPNLFIDVKEKNNGQRSS